MSLWKLPPSFLETIHKITLELPLSQVGNCIFSILFKLVLKNNVVEMVK